MFTHRLHSSLPSFSRIHASNTDWVLKHWNRNCENQEHLVRENTVFLCLLFIYMKIFLITQGFTVSSTFFFLLIQTLFWHLSVLIRNTKHLEYGSAHALSCDLVYLKTGLSCFYCTLPLFISPSLGGENLKV